MRKAFLAFLLLLCLTHREVHGDIYNKIPAEDRYILERFFGYLITSTESGFTLCGQKPMSIEWCVSPFLDPAAFNVRFFDLGFDYLILLQGIRTWEKYESLFPKNRFAIVSYHSHSPLMPSPSLM